VQCRSPKLRFLLPCATWSPNCQFPPRVPGSCKRRQCRRDATLAPGQPAVSWTATENTRACHVRKVVGVPWSLSSGGQDSETPEINTCQTDPRNHHEAPTTPTSCSGAAEREERGSGFSNHPAVQSNVCRSSFPYGVVVTAGRSPSHVSYQCDAALLKAIPSSGSTHLLVARYAAPSTYQASTYAVKTLRRQPYYTKDCGTTCEGISTTGDSKKDMIGV
jgi:hypothetical protein